MFELQILWTPTTTNSQVNCDIPLFVLSSVVHCDWLKHWQPLTHQVIQPVTGLFTPSYLICVIISTMQNMLANQICVLYTCKSCPIVGELASSPMEGTIMSKPFKFNSSWIPCRCWIWKSLKKFWQNSMCWS